MQLLGVLIGLGLTSLRMISDTLDSFTYCIGSGVGQERSGAIPPRIGFADGWRHHNDCFVFRCI